MHTPFHELSRIRHRQRGQTHHGHTTHQTSHCRHLGKTNISPRQYAEPTKTLRNRILQSRATLSAQQHSPPRRPAALRPLGTATTIPHRVCGKRHSAGITHGPNARPYMAGRSRYRNPHTQSHATQQPQSPTSRTANPLTTAI